MTKCLLFCAVISLLLPESDSGSVSLANFKTEKCGPGLSNLALNLAAQQMTPVQILEAERRVQEWRVNHNDPQD
jgi:hypothetical protein